MSARSEKTLHAGNREIVILFTNRAIADAEVTLGKSIIALANGFADGSCGIGDVAILLRAGMEAFRRDAQMGGKPVTIDDAYAVMDEIGFTETTTEVMTAIADVLSYGQNGEEKN